MFFLRTLSAERQKLRRCPVWIAFVILPLLPAVMGTFNYSQNIGILNDEWYSLWTQHTLFYCYFFLPALIGVYCAYLCRLEHLHHNWNAVLTAPVPVGYVFISKLTTVAFMILLTQGLLGIFYFLAGKLVGLPSSPPAALFLWLLLGFWGGVAIASLQLCLSFLIRSFAIPVGISFIGGIAGMAMLVKGYGAYFPYSLPSLGMNANSPLDDMTIGVGSFLGHGLVMIIVFSGVGILCLKQRDVNA